MSMIALGALGNALSPLGQIVRPDPLRGTTALSGAPSFSDRIGSAIDDLARSQAKAAQSANDFELGRTTDLASVMIDQQVSSLGFQFALNVRNKALTAYRDIMNMPV